MITEIDQDRMAAASFVFWLDEPCATSPFVDQNLDNFSRHGRVIDKGNDQPFGAGAYCDDSASDRRAHLTIRIGIDRKGNLDIFKLCSNVFSAMTDNYHDVFDPGSTQVVEAAFNYCSITKREQRLEGAHAARAAGGEKNCADVIQVERD